MLTWARDEECPWDSRTCHYAAHGGQLEVLQWARAHHCPWEHDYPWWEAGTFGYAASGGHMEVLRWLLASGCPWGERTCELAAEAGNLEAGAYTRPLVQLNVCTFCRTRWLVSLYQ